MLLEIKPKELATPSHSVRTSHGTYGSHTAEFQALRARIEAIGTYEDQVEIESVLIEPSNGELISNEDVTLS